jgi:hypothetical protein
LQHDLAGAVTPEAFISDCRARDVAAQVFEFFALISAAAHGCVQAEAVRVGAQSGRGWLVRTGQAAEAQHFLSCATSWRFVSLLDSRRRGCRVYPKTELSQHTKFVVNLSEPVCSLFGQRKRGDHQEDVSKVRRMHNRKGLSRIQIARRTGLSCNTM